MTQILEDVTTIQIKRKTRDKLDKYGTRHESYDDILNNILNELESRRKDSKKWPESQIEQLKALIKEAKEALGLAYKELNKKWQTEQEGR